MLREAIDSDDPVIFMEPKSRYWSKQNVTLPVTTEPMTRGRVVREGSDVTLIAYGPTVATALETAELAEAEGLSIEVIDLRSLSPFDDETVGASVRKTSRAAVIHEAAQFGGYGAEVAARVTEREFYHLAAPILRITGFDIPYPAPKLEEFYLPTAGADPDRAEHLGVGDPMSRQFLLPDLGEGLDRSGDRRLAGRARRHRRRRPARRGGRVGQVGRRTAEPVRRSGGIAARGRGADGACRGAAAEHPRQRGRCRREACRMRRRQCPGRRCGSRRRRMHGGCGDVGAESAGASGAVLIGYGLPQRSRTARATPRGRFGARAEGSAAFGSVRRALADQALPRRVAAGAQTREGPRLQRQRPGRKRRGIARAALGCAVAHRVAGGRLHRSRRHPYPDHRGAQAGFGEDDAFPPGDSGGDDLA